MEQFLDATAALATNEALAALADDTARLIKEPAEIGWEQVIAATATDMASPALASINRAQIAPGHIKEAVGRSSEMLNFVKEATGIDGMLTMTDAGPTNEIAFIFGVDSGAAADAANAALAANADWVDMMDAAAGMFVTGTNHRVYAARLP